MQTRQQSKNSLNITSSSPQSLCQKLNSPEYTSFIGRKVFCYSIVFLLIGILLDRALNVLKNSKIDFVNILANLIDGFSSSVIVMSLLGVILGFFLWVGKFFIGSDSSGNLWQNQSLSQKLNSAEYTSFIGKRIFYYSFILFIIARAIRFLISDLRHVLTNSKMDFVNAVVSIINLASSFLSFTLGMSLLGIILGLFLWASKFGGRCCNRRFQNYPHHGSGSRSRSNPGNPASPNYWNRYISVFDRTNPSNPNYWNK